MKIAQIVCTFPPYPGGIGQSAQRFGALLATDNEVVTFTLRPQNIAVTDSAAVQYLHPWLRYGHGGLPWSLLGKLSRFDCLYLHYPFFGGAEIVWLFLKCHPKTKLVIHYHMDTADLKWFLKPLAWPSALIRKSLFRRASAIVVASYDYVRQSQVADLYKKWPHKFKEIPFGLDTDRYRPKMPENDRGLVGKTKAIVNFVTKNIIKRGRINLLFVGGLDSAHYFKGLPVLLNALATLPNRQWRLGIVGGGNLLPDYIKQTEKLGLEHQVKFLGRLSEDELIRTYQAADLFILPSINRHEAFGLVLTEAMACGVPVIASALPGVRQVFRDGLDGLYAAAGDSADLADKINRLLSNEEQRVAMGHSARAYAVDRYSWDSIGEKLRRLFL